MTNILSEIITKLDNNNAVCRHKMTNISPINTDWYNAGRQTNQQQLLCIYRVNRCSELLDKGSEILCRFQPILKETEIRKKSKCWVMMVLESKHPSSRKPKHHMLKLYSRICPHIKPSLWLNGLMVNNSNNSLSKKSEKEEPQLSKSFALNAEVEIKSTCFLGQEKSIFSL